MNEMTNLMHYRAYKRALEFHDNGEFEDGFAVFKIKPSELLDEITEILSEEYLACPLKDFRQFRDIQNVVFEEVTFYTRRGDGNGFSAYRGTAI